MSASGHRRAGWRQRVRAVAFAAALLVGTSACGAAQDGGSSGAQRPGGGGVTSDSPTASTSGPSDGAADLTIVVVDGAGASTTHHLTCAPPGGDHPSPEVACRVLAERGVKALPPVPAGALCTQIYGGPETAHITGTWRGEQVDSRLSRQNGCEIARWNALAGLLPRAGA
jgi:hypothetical protein